MAIGSSIAYSIPVVGTTVDSFLRMTNTSFVDSITIGGVDVPLELMLRQASTMSNRKTFGLTYRIGANLQDDPGALTKGRASISVSVDAVPGSVLTATEVAKHTRYAVSTVLASTLIESLYNGSYL